jgi:hypothetical protein
MTDQDKKTLRRIWGRGKAYQDLLASDVTEAMLLALMAAYEDHGFHGPHWNKSKGLWWIEKFGDGTPSTCTWRIHRERSITEFLDVGAEIARPEWKQRAAS